MRDACELLLRLMQENNFPKVWVPSPENRDLRQLLWHRHRLVQMRTRIMNQLQALAMNEGAIAGRKTIQRYRGGHSWRSSRWLPEGQSTLARVAGSARSHESDD